MIERVLAMKGECCVARSMVAVAALDPTGVFAVDIETFGDGVNPGDCAGYPGHGIAGVSICNVRGEAQYIVVQDGRECDGVPISTLVDYLNRNWFKSQRVAVFHNSKFDLSFLMARGLRCDPQHVLLRDTWIVQSMRCKGIFSSNRLKDLMKSVFNLTVDTESRLREWLDAHQTADYGLIPTEIMAPYACDDVRYTLALYFHQGGLTPKERELHDLYLRNTLAVNEAELRGIAIDGPQMAGRMQEIAETLPAQRALVLEALGSADVDPDDEQAMLKHLHFKNMHSAPRSHYGEVKFVFDDEFLRAVRHPLAVAYHRYARLQRFRHVFSGRDGQMRGRLFKRDEVVGIHPSFWLSVFSKGGMPQCKRPDFVDGVPLRPNIRKLFVPRADRRFVILKGIDLFVQLLAHYARDAEMARWITEGGGGANFCRLFSVRTGLSQDANSLCFRRLFEGSGASTLKNRLKVAGVRVPDARRGVGEVYNRFEAAVHDFGGMLGRVGDLLRSQGYVTDRAGRVLSIPEDRRWRAVAILLQSSMGSMVSHYLDLFVRVGKKTGADLVMAHQDEFVFEVPLRDDAFGAALKGLLARSVFEPRPSWLVIDGKNTSRRCWEMGYVDVHDLVVGSWL